MAKENEKDETFEGFSLLTSDSLPKEVVEVDPETIKSTPVLNKEEEKEEETSEEIKAREEKEKSDAEEESEKEKSDAEEEEEKEKEKSSLNKDEEKPEEEEEEEEKEKDSETSAIKDFADVLAEKGAIDLDEDTFEDSEEGLVKAVEETVSKRIEDWKSSLGPDTQKLIEYMEDGGDLTNYLQVAAVPDYNDISDEDLEENVETQKKVVAELLTLEKYSSEEITQEIADYVEAGMLFSKSKRAVGRLNQHNKAVETQEFQAQKDYAKGQKEKYGTWLETLEKDIDTREDIAGFKIGKKEKKDFFKYITEPVRIKEKNPQNGKEEWVQKTRMMIDSAQDPDAQLKMAWLYFNKFDFSKVEKQAKKQVASDLKEKLERSKGEGKNLRSSKRTGAPEEVTADFSLFKKLT